MASPFLNLEVEIFYEITSYLFPETQDPRTDLQKPGQYLDIAALVLTCKAGKNLLNGKLYAHAAVNRPSVLFWACYHGSVGTVEKLLKADCDPHKALIYNINHIDTYTPGRYTVDRKKKVGDAHWPFGDPAASRQLTWGNQFPGMGGPRATSGIYSNTTGGNMTGGELIRHLIGSNVMETSGVAFPLNIAIEQGHLALVKVLLDDGARFGMPSVVPAQEPHGSRDYIQAKDPKYTAIAAGHKDMLAALLAASPASWQIIDTGHPHHIDNFSVLHAAAACGRVEVFDLLLQHVSNIRPDLTTAVLLELRDSDRLTPLWCAYLCGHIDLMDHLAGMGANIDAKRADGFTPLLDACLYGDKPMAEKLISLGADVNQTTDGDIRMLRSGFLQYMPLSRVVHDVLSGWKRVPTAERASEDALSIALTTAPRRPLDLCCLRGMFPENRPTETVEIAALLMAAGADISMMATSTPFPNTGQYPMPPLVAAAATRQPALVRELLSRGADANARDPKGISPLMALVGYHQSENVIGRLSAASVHYSSGKCFSGNEIACLIILLQHGADPNARDPSGVCVLARLCLAHSEKAGNAHRTVYHQQSPSTGDYNNCVTGALLDVAWRGPLSESGIPVAVELLVKHGADPNFQDATVGDSLLAYMFSHRFWDAAALLARKGARLHFTSFWSPPYKYDDLAKC